MLIKLVLSALLVLLAVLVMSQRSASRTVRWAVVASVLTGGYFVWWPEHATVAAHAVGVGRGTDLLVYLWVLITFGVMLLMYLKISATDRVITLLARELALMRGANAQALPAEANWPKPADYLRDIAIVPQSRGAGIVSVQGAMEPSTTP